MAKAVVIELTKDHGHYPKGTQFELESAARAQRVYPDSRIVRFADGSPYEAPAEREVAEPPTDERAAPKGRGAAGTPS